MASKQRYLSDDEFMKPPVASAPGGDAVKFLSDDEFMKPAAAPTPATQGRPMQSMTVRSGPAPQGFLDRLLARYRGEVQGGQADMRAGAAGAGGPRSFNPLWSSTGADMQTAGGAMRYLMSPVEALSQTVVGDPVRNVAGNVAGDTANLAAQVFSGAAGPALMRELPAAARALPGAINEVASAVGGVARGAVNTVDDVAQNLLRQAERKQAEKLANAAPTREALTTEKNAAYKNAYAQGAVVKPEKFASFVDSDLARLAAEKRIRFKDTLTPQAKNLKDNLETYRGRDLTLEDLDDLMQENADFVAEAASKAKATGTRRDLSAAQTMSKAVRDFVNTWEPESIGAQGAEALSKAKELARRVIKMRQIDEIIDVATRLDDPAEIQNAFRAIAKDTNEFKNFTAAERKLIEQIAQDSRLSGVAEVIPVVGPSVRAAGKLAERARGVNAGGKLKLAKELKDLIARGEKAQAEAAANKSGPSFGQRLNDTLRPGPPNSGNRR